MDLNQEILEPPSPNVAPQNDTSLLSPTPVAHNESPSVYLNDAVTEARPLPDCEEPVRHLQDIHKEACRSAPSRRCAFSPKNYKSNFQFPHRLGTFTFSQISSLPPLLTPSFFPPGRKEFSHPRRNPVIRAETSSVVPPGDRIVKATSTQITPTSLPPEICTDSQLSKPLGQPESEVVEKTLKVTIESGTRLAEAQTLVVGNVSPLPPHTHSEATDPPLPPDSPLQEVKEPTPPQPDPQEPVADFSADAITPRNSTPTQIPELPLLQPASPVAADIGAEDTQGSAHTAPDSEPNSTTDAQEIANMLVNNSEGVTDEELLAIGLCYPES